MSQQRTGSSGVESPTGLDASSTSESRSVEPTGATDQRAANAGASTRAATDARTTESDGPGVESPGVEGPDAGGSDADSSDPGRTGTASADDLTFDDVSVVMGTYNEEAAIATVIEDVREITDGRAEVICVDGSSDRTPEIAREHGARVIEQEPQGYGVAVERALRAADRPVVVTTDCDDTYPMEALPEFLAEIRDGADVVSGDRISPGADAMPAFNRFGNQVFALLGSVLVGRRVHDVTTGMRAYRRDVIEEIDWTQNTGLSAELLMRPILRGYDVRERTIDYRERAGETKLDPLLGGAEICGSILKVGVEERLGLA